ncbi:hypothetical protein X801_05175, partial [Opisthorchis viverrini]
MTRHHGEICSNLCRTNWDWHINNLAFYKPSSLKKGTFAHSQTVRCNKSRSARSNSEIVCLFGYCKKLSSGEPGSRNTAERSGRNFNDIGKNIMPLTTQRSANQVGNNSKIVCLFGYCKKLSSGEPGSRNTAERSGRNFNDIEKNIMPLTTQRSANQVG